MIVAWHSFRRSRENMNNDGEPAPAQGRRENAGGKWRMEFRPQSRLVLTNVIDFIPGVAAYESKIAVDFFSALGKRPHGGRARHAAQ
jgi:hypothetical protein